MNFTARIQESLTVEVGRLLFLYLLPSVHWSIPLYFCMLKNVNLTVQGTEQPQ